MKSPFVDGFFAIRPVRSAGGHAPGAHDLHHRRQRPLGRHRTARRLVAWFLDGGWGDWLRHEMTRKRWENHGKLWENE